MYKFFLRALIATGISVLVAQAFRAEATIDISLQMQLGNPSGATADANNHEHYLIQRTVEAIDYNDNLGLPNWASWDLTASDIGPSGRSPDFVTDTSLPGSFYEVTTTDYSGSGFDRGHMCPSADRTDNDADNELVFLMSNIIPQTANNNSGVWGTFEGYCRTLAQSGNELLIICGPSGFNGTFIQPSQEVFVPGYTWKVVVVVPNGAGSALSRITTATRVIALKIPNTDSVGGAWQSYVTSARQIEVDTGFTFFSALPTNIAAALRDKVDGVSGVLPTMTGFSPGSGSVGSSVVVTGNNFSSASAVTFHGVSASFHVDSSTQITVTVPLNTTPGPISVTTPAGTAVGATNFNVTGAVSDLAATVTHFGNFAQRDTGDTYTIIVTNTGTLASAGAVNVAEMLPAGLTVTGISGVRWTANLGTLTCTRSTQLLAGATYPPIVVTVNVASNAPATATNTVVVSGGGEVNAANDTALDVTTINAAASSGPVTTLIGWDMSGLPGGSGNYGPTVYAPTMVAANLSAGGLMRGSGVGTSGMGAARAWGGNAFTSTTEAAAIGANQFMTFSAVVSNGYTVSYNRIVKFDYRHSATGPATGVLQCQVGNGAFTDIAALSYPNNAGTGDSLSPINLAGVPALQNVGAGTNVTFRIVNYGGGSAGTWYIFDVAQSSALDFAVEGSISAVSTSHADLAVAMTHTGVFRQGDNNDVYTITVTNAGSGSSSGEVTVTDVLPAGLNATALQGSGWVADLNTLTCTRAENLAPGASYPPITLIVAVATNAGLSLTNIAQVSGGGDTNLANNTASDVSAIVPLTPIQAWRLQWFGIADNTGVAADGAVNSSDNLPNIFKYAFGLDPFTPAAAPVTYDFGTGHLRVTATKNSTATDVRLFAETAGGLNSTWTTNGITIDQNSATNYQAHMNAAIGSAAIGFLRLSVTRP